MIENLIVIATNNGKEQLERLLTSMKDSLGLNDFVLIVNTSGKDSYGYQLLKRIGIFGDAVSIPGGYDTGAYKKGFELMPDAKRYMFMHDSLEIIEKDWLSEFASKLTGKVGVVAYTQFHFFFDVDMEQQIWVENQYGHDFPYYGIFGPIFMASNRAMSKIQLPETPKNKLEQQGGERAWAMAFHLKGFEMVAINEEFWPQAMFEGKSKLLKKYFPHRK